VFSGLEIIILYFENVNLKKMFEMSKFKETMKEKYFK
jgi:hypothetical protein